MSTLWDTIKKGLEVGAKKAKEGVHIAAEKTEELGKKGKVMLEISNIKRKIEKNFTELGGKTYHLIQEENVENVSSVDEVKELINTINSLEDDLKAKQDELERIGTETGEAEEKASSEDSETSSET